LAKDTSNSFNYKLGGTYYSSDFFYVDLIG